jgi:hypothetical protein
VKLYLLEQTVVDGYNTFDSCVVVAESEQSAKLMHPAGDSIGEDSYTWPTQPTSKLRTSASPRIQLRA